MTIDERKQNIALQIANNATNSLIEELAARDEQIDALKARVAELEKAPLDTPAKS